MDLIAELRKLRTEDERRNFIKLCRLGMKVKSMKEQYLADIKMVKDKINKGEITYDDPGGLDILEEILKGL